MRNFIDFCEINLEEMAVVIETNLFGVIYGCNVALNSMLERGYGVICYLEGHGSGSSKQVGRTLHGTN